MPRTLSRESGRLLAANDAGSLGSISSKPCHPRRKPTTSQPRSSALSVTDRMQALRPGTSPPPVRMPIRIGGGGLGKPAEFHAERVGRARHVDFGAVEDGALAGLQLAHRGRDGPFVDDLVLRVL